MRSGFTKFEGGKSDSSSEAVDSSWNELLEGQPSTSWDSLEQEAQSFNPEKTLGLKQIQETLAELHEKEASDPFFAKTKLVGDGGHIEGQQYSFVRERDGAVKMYFRLSESDYDEIMRANIDASRQQLKLGEIPSGEGVILPVGDAGITCAISASRYDRIASGLSDSEVLYYSGWSEELKRTIESPQLPQEQEQYSSAMYRTMDRQVIINIPNEFPLESASQDIVDFMYDKLGIEHALTPPSPEDYAEEEKRMYSWHHKNNPEDGVQLPTNLERQEVFDGYDTIVEPGKSEQYEAQYGRFAFFHQLSSISNLDSILSNGICATTERFERGVTAYGKGSVADMKYGGAGHAFTRLITEKGLEDDEMWPAEAFLVLKPQLADRTDWHTHDFNAYGRADEENMSKRLSPDELLASMSSNGFQTMDYNEQLFPKGISPEMISAIMVPTEEGRTKALQLLHAANIHEFNGMPIESLIVTCNRRQDIINLSHRKEASQTINNDLPMAA